MFTGNILNGNRLIAEIKFRIDLKWCVSVCGKAIDLEPIGFLSKWSVAIIFLCLTNFKQLKHVVCNDV
jgi:hypothetical protein